MNRKFCLLIGDGFTKDFVGKSLNTSKPLSNFNSNSISYNGLFSRISPIIDDLKTLSTEFNDDFEAVRVYLKYHEYDDTIECQLRRFLAIAYSKLQLELDKQEKSDWRWLRWLKENKDELSFVISFNYDLLLENTLRDISLPYFRTGTSETEPGVPVFKPHGSIDFDLEVHFDTRKTKFTWYDIANDIINRQSNWNMITSLNQIDNSVKIIPKNHWLLPRFQADLIPPSQENYHKNLEWVNKGFNLYNDVSNNFTDLIMVGHSYSLCDRPEIDHFLERLHPNTIVHIVNPQILGDLTEKLESLNLGYRTIVDFKTMPW